MPKSSRPITSSDDKHTERPWVSIPMGDVITVEADDVLIASCSVNQNGEANGPFIAAAPAMFEITEEISRWGCDCDHPEPGEDGIIVCLSCRARAALAAARGEVADA